MSDIDADWDKVIDAFHVMRRATNLPERWKATLDYNSECCAFVQKHEWEICRMLMERASKIRNEE